MSVKSDYTIDKIRAIYIFKEKDCVFQWNPKGLRSTIFPIELLPAKENVIENEFYQTSIKDLRAISFKKGQYIAIISSDATIQFQFLEAFIEALLEKFLSTYAMIFSNQFIVSDNSLFSGFIGQIEPIFQHIKDERIKFVRGDCRICKTEYWVCIKKDLIEKTTDYPVALVHIHRGHGMLLYIDANFRVRGVERVSING